MSVAANWEWAERYMPAVRRILQDHFNIPFAVRTGTPEEDRSYGTDVVLESSRGSFGVRVRRTGYRDLTLRTRSRGGGLTEVDKWRCGDRPRFYFVGWVADVGDDFSRWVVLDVDRIVALRLPDTAMADEVDNGDGTAFIPIPIIRLQLHGCVLASGPNATVPMRPPRPPTLFEMEEDG